MLKNDNCVMKINKSVKQKPYKLHNFNCLQNIKNQFDLKTKKKKLWEL